MKNFVVQVHHDREPTFGFGDVPAPPWPDRYDRVATVRVQAHDHEDAAERAFGLSQHIERDWRDNPQVVAKGPGRVRSTSVGDVVVVQLVEGDDPAGWTRRTYLCASAGWRDLGAS